MEDVLRNNRSITATELFNAARQILLNICRAEEKPGIKDFVISERSLRHKKGLRRSGSRILLGSLPVVAYGDHVYNDDCVLAATEAEGLDAASRHRRRG